MQVSPLPCLEWFAEMYWDAAIYPFLTELETRVAMS
jgi:hypothetical protein